MTLTLNPCNFDPNPYWSQPLDISEIPSVNSVSLFDQNGYDLCELEIMYSQINGNKHSLHRNYSHVALKQPWFYQQPTPVEGNVLNHALIFERKGYSDKALEQLENWAKLVPLFYKMAKYRPKWGLDFSMDWADHQGNVFEVFHYEFDTFDYPEILQVKTQLETKILHIDWDAAARELLRRKQEWHNLDFFAQSDYKCAFFGLPSERFKMVAWQ